MLVLTRKVNERIQIGENVTITVTKIKGNVAVIGVDAPKDMTILRGEIVERNNRQCKTKT